VLVGLIVEGRHVAGMIDLPALDETLLAIDGTTTGNGIAVRVSGCRSLVEARLSTTDPTLFDDPAPFERVRRAARVTRFGLDALGYARVATGDLDLVIESGLKCHDYDALVAVVRGAGGVIGNWRGGDDLGEGDVVAAASRQLYDEAVALLGA
jgi:myo-inositol-1(or 4)-monophosphatase